MKTLDEFNASRSWLSTGPEPHPNNIECPDCGKELWDSEPQVTLTSNPPQKRVHCPACDFAGLRLA